MCRDPVRVVALGRRGRHRGGDLRLGDNDLACFALLVLGEVVVIDKVSAAAEESKTDQVGEDTVKGLYENLRKAMERGRNSQLEVKDGSRGFDNCHDGIVSDGLVKTGWRL